MIFDDDWDEVITSKNHVLVSPWVSRQRAFGVIAFMYVKMWLEVMDIENV